MKKVGAILIAVMMLFVGTVSVFATENAIVFTVSEATVSKGSEVEITVDVSQNSGMAGLIVTLDYEETVFSLEHCENGTVYSSQPQIGKNFVWATADGHNTTNNGTLITFTFSALEGAVEGAEYPISILIRQCSDSNRNAVTTSVVDGKISILESEPEPDPEPEPKPESKITHADMELAENITVNYYAKLDQTYTDPQMRFTMNGEQTTVNGIATGNVNEYAFAFQGVAPQCMGDNIQAELICGDKVLDIIENYSVKTYCLNTLAKDANTLGLSAEKFSALRTLLADLLEYGASAQLYFGYKTHALVNEGVEGSRDFVELTKTLQYTEKSDRDEIKITSVGAILENTNALYVQFLAPNLTDDTCYIIAYNENTDTEVEYALSDATLINAETGEYRLVLDPLYAMGYDDKYVIELFAPRSATSTRLTSVHFMEYSMSSFVYSMQNEKNGDLLTSRAKLLRTIYNYGCSANDYAAIAS